MELSTLINIFAITGMATAILFFVFGLFEYKFGDVPMVICAILFIISGVCWIGFIGRAHIAEKEEFCLARGMQLYQDYDSNRKDYCISDEKMYSLIVNKEGGLLPYEKTTFRIVKEVVILE